MKRSFLICILFGYFLIVTLSFTYPGSNLRLPAISYSNRSTHFGRIKNGYSQQQSNVHGPSIQRKYDIIQLTTSVNDDEDMVRVTILCISMYKYAWIFVLGTLNNFII